MEQFLLPLDVVDFDNNAAAYGRVRAALEERDMPSARWIRSLRPTPWV
ncbi:MAG TPA: hypothetical protein VE225_08930 [Rubrobacteraceae bacterium]|nr:hypothetical protein [Rubrobacteraceae bacterium]